MNNIISGIILILILIVIVSFIIIRIKRKKFNSSFTYGILYFLMIPMFALIYNIMPDCWISYSSGMENSFFSNIYFSVVIITTLGFGDIMPTNQYSSLIIGLESIIGIIFIGFFLNSLSHEHSRKVTEMEQKKEYEKWYKGEFQKLIRYSKIISIDIENYTRFARVITLPIKRRNGEDWISGKIITDWNGEFVFSDLQDLYKGCSYVTTDMKVPAAKYYYKYQYELAESFEKLLENVEIKTWEPLESLCIKLLRNCKSEDGGDYILKKCDEVLNENNSRVNLDTKMIKEHKGDIINRPSDGLRPYKELYRTLKNNMKLIMCYKKALSLIQKQNKNITINDK